MSSRETSITPADLKRLLLNVYTRYRAGRIDEDRARQETLILNVCLEAVSEDTLNERLVKIREALRG